MFNSVPQTFLWSLKKFHLSNQVSCRSFGCPHVGNQDFVNLFNSEVKGKWKKNSTLKFFLAILYHVISKFYHRRDAYRYAIQFDPIPLLLNPISSYGHVDEKIEIPDLLGKHKIEYYIIVLVRNRSKKHLSDIYN